MTWQQALIDPQATLREALAAIDQGGVGIALVVDTDERLVGIIAGLDARRAMLEGATLDDAVQPFINGDPTVANGDMDDQELLHLMHTSRHYQIPIIDKNHQITGLRLMQELTQGTPLSIPNLGGNEWAYVKDCLDTNYVSSVGGYVDRFEKQVAEYIGASHGIACTSGTHALHTAAIIAGLGPGTEVLLPTLTFIAPVNAVSYTGTQPIFCDSTHETMGLSPESLSQFLTAHAERGADGRTFNKSTGNQIVAVIVVHIFGHPVDMDPILQICEDYNLCLIEDAAESMAATYKGRQTGNIGHIGCLSFNGNKIITTGGGGMVITSNDEMAARARHLTTQAKSDGFRYEHDEVGFNYRLSNVLAAIGVAQMEQLDEHLEHKRRIFRLYRDAFQRLPDVELFEEKDWAHSNYWLNTIFVPNETRDILLQRLNDHGVMARPLWQLCHRQPMYADCQRTNLDNSETLHDHGISLPSSIGLTETEIRFIADTVETVLGETTGAR
ncbi:MAG: LegC family aminotransferase [Alphaproteobacteria bacterium]|nr:LegC family aminotransferase [Alphaproteobacteria bacterium]